MTKITKLRLRYILTNNWGKMFEWRIGLIKILLNAYIKLDKWGLGVIILYSYKWNNRKGEDMYGDGVGIKFQILFISIQLGILKEERLIND